MSKIVHILILSSLFSLSTYAIDINSTTEILKQATEATRELSKELEPIINSNNITSEENIESNLPIIEKSLTEMEIEQNPLKSESFIQPPLLLETVEENQTTTLYEDIETITTIESIEPPPPIEIVAKSVLTIPLTENNITIEEVTEREVVEKGDPRKGKNIFKYVLKEDCNMTAYKFAEKHTQEEWLEILEENKIKETIIKTCPNVEKYYQNKWTDDLYQFFYEASNEDEIPEC
jgi:hypothetical protein